MNRYIRIPFDGYDVAVADGDMREEPSFLAIHSDALRKGVRSSTSVFFSPRDVVSLIVLHRVLGGIIDRAAPGVLSPLPEGEDTSFAGEIRDAADALWAEIHEEEE